MIVYLGLLRTGIVIHLCGNTRGGNKHVRRKSKMV